MNAFRCTPNKSLDREYLRICAIYKILKRGATKEFAKTIAARPIPGCPKKDGWLDATIEIWLNGPLRNRNANQ